MWKESILKQGHGYQAVDSILTTDHFSQTDYLKVSQQQGGTDFYSRSRIPGTHTFFDSQILASLLTEAFQDMDPAVIADIGCGDGRATTWFLENTKANIVAIDGSLDSLLRLKQNYLQGHPEYEQRVLLIHANVLDIPLVDRSCDLVWSFEVLCYLLNDAEKGVQESLRLLKPSGHYLMGERNKEFGLLHEFLNRGPAGFLEAYESSQVVEDWNDSRIRSRVFPVDELERILTDQGLSILKRKGVSFFPLIASFLKSRGMFPSEIEQSAPDLAKSFIGLSGTKGSLPRSTIFITVKN